MSDRSALTLIVYACPEDQREAVLSIIAEHNLTTDGVFGVGEDDTLSLGERYGDDECRLDTYEEIADELQKRAPGATFCVWNDPKYEWLGGLRMHVPELGMYGAECDADGNPVFTSKEVIEIARIEDAAERGKRVGLPWLDRMVAA